MNIRPILSSDTDAVVALWLVVFPEYSDPLRTHRDPRSNVERKLAFGDGFFWLAELDGRVVGSVMAGYDGHRGWVYSLGVHPEARRLGVGRALLVEAERALGALGCPKVNLQVFSTNDRALTFWRSAGYVQDDVVSLGKRLPQTPRDQVRSG